MNKIASIGRYKPVIFDRDGAIVNRGNEVLRYSLDGKFAGICKFNDSVVDRILDRFGLSYRLRRSGVYSGTKHDGDFFFCFRRKLYRYSVMESRLQQEMTFRAGHGPMRLTSICNMPGFDDCLVFGEYFGNKDKRPVHIYSRLADSSWQIVHTFDQGEINHIHNIIPDHIRECVWVLTGDYDGAAAIWRATDNFAKLEKVVGGDQVYRSCIAYPINDGLLYATDTHLQPNSIRLLHLSDGQWKSEKLIDINGPCVYGCELKDYFLFSTVTEPSPPKGGKLKTWLDRDPSPVIRKNQSEVISCTKDGLEFTVEMHNPKDKWPYRLFQFGSIMLYGSPNEERNCVATFSIANTNDDLQLTIWEV